MARRLLPLLDRVLVEKLAAPTKSTGGVILPESAVSKINEAKVLAVGPGRRGEDGKLIPMEIKEGDSVLLPDYGGHALKYEDKELQLFRADELLAVLKD